MTTSDELNAQLQEIALEIIEAKIDRAAQGIRRLQRRQKVLRAQLKVVAHKEKRDHAELGIPEFGRCDFVLVVALVVAGLLAILGTVFMQVPVP